MRTGVFVFVFVCVCGGGVERVGGGDDRGVRVIETDGIRTACVD